MASQQSLDDEQVDAAQQLDTVLTTGDHDAPGGRPTAKLAQDWMRVILASDPYLWPATSSTAQQRAWDELIQRDRLREAGHRGYLLSIPGPSVVMGTLPLALNLAKGISDGDAEFPGRLLDSTAPLGRNGALSRNPIRVARIAQWTPACSGSLPDTQQGNARLPELAPWPDFLRVEALVMDAILAGGGFELLDVTLLRAAVMRAVRRNLQQTGRGEARARTYNTFGGLLSAEAHLRGGLAQLGLEDAYRAHIIDIGSRTHTQEYRLFVGRGEAVRARGVEVLLAACPPGVAKDSFARWLCEDYACIGTRSRRLAAAPLTRTLSTHLYAEMGDRLDGMMTALKSAS